jgi:hypothetical protein
VALTDEALWLRLIACKFSAPITMPALFLRKLAAVVLLATTSYGESRLLIQSAPALDAYRIQWAAGDKLLVSKSRRGEIRVWKADSGSLLQALPPVDPMGAAIAVSPDGSLIAGIRNGRAVVMKRLTGATVWEDGDAETRSIARLDPPFLTIASVGLVKRVDFTKQVVTHRWNVDGDRGVSGIDLMNDGATAVFLSDRTAVALDRDFKEIGRINSDKAVPFYFGVAAGDSLALATFGGVFVASIKGKENQWRSATQSPAAFGVRLSPDGLALAVGNNNGTVTIRSTADLKELWQTPPIQGINDLAWSSDQSKLAFATSSAGMVVLDAKSGEILQSFGAEKGIDPMEVADRVLFDGRAQWLGILRADDRFVHVPLSDGDVRFFNTQQAVQPATRPQSESARDLILPKSPRFRYQNDGRLIEKLAPPSADVFDSGTCGTDGIYFRNREHVFIQRTAGGKTGKEGIFPLGIGLRCIFSADGRHALHDAAAGKPEYVVRKAPTWEVAGVIPKQPGDDTLTAVWVAPDQQWLTWMGHTGMWRYDFKTQQRTELVPSLGSRNDMLAGTHASAPGWFLTFSTFANPARYRIHAARDGSVLHEPKPWRAFADELDLQVVGVSSNKRGLWMCGSGSRPILVDLETGQPVLRLHVFDDSTYLWETPDGKVAGSPEAKSKCLFIPDDGYQRLESPEVGSARCEGHPAVLRPISVDLNQLVSTGPPSAFLNESPGFPDGAGKSRA